MTEPEEMCDWRKRENEMLCDSDPMPFGKHKGIPMQDVPASYLHWLWANGKKDLRVALALRILGLGRIPRRLERQVA